MFSPTVTFRRHEAAYRRTHADDARTPTHDASSSADDDASQAGHDATRQIRASGFPLFFVIMNRLSSEDTWFNTWIYQYDFFLNCPFNLKATVPDDIVLFFVTRATVFITCHLIRFYFRPLQTFFFFFFKTSFLVPVSTWKYPVSLWQTVQHVLLMSALDSTVFVVLFSIVLIFFIGCTSCIVLINKTVISNRFCPNQSFWASSQVEAFWIVKTFMGRSHRSVLWQKTQVLLSAEVHLQRGPVTEILSKALLSIWYSFCHCTADAPPHYTLLHTVCLQLGI